jgi:hypothetical protein
MSTMGAPTTPETHAFVLSAFETAVRKYAGRAVDPIDIAAARVE